MKVGRWRPRCGDDIDFIILCFTMVIRIFIEIRNAPFEVDRVPFQFIDRQIDSGSTYKILHWEWCHRSYQFKGTSFDLHSCNPFNYNAFVLHTTTTSTHQQMELNPLVRTVPLFRFRCTHFRHFDLNCTDDVDSNTH